MTPHNYDVALTTALARMTNNVPMILIGSTLADVSALFWKMDGAFDTIKNVYVIDATQKFIGVFLSREIFRHPAHTKVEDVFIPAERVCVIYGTDDQEIAVKKAITMDVDSVVVTTNDNTLLGAISIKELLKILQEETQEDLAAEGHFDMSPRLDSILEIPLMESITSRAPWIVLGLFGGVGAAIIIGYFEPLLAKYIMLAGYIPLAVYIAGAVSAQIQMSYIRDTSLNPNLPFRQYITRQAMVVATLAAILSLVVLGIGLFVEETGHVAYIIALGIGLSILTAIGTGVLVPKLLALVVKDPANATTPVATIVSDTATIIIFFVTASLLLA